MILRLIDPAGVSVSSRLADERSRKSVPDLITLHVSAEDLQSLPDPLVRFRTVAIPTANIAFPRFGPLADIVDVVVTSNDEINPMAVLNSFLVCHCSELVC